MTQEYSSYLNHRYHLFCFILAMLALSTEASEGGNLCSRNPERTKNILEQLENRTLCQSLTPADCFKLIAGETGAGGVIAAKSSLQLGQLDLDPDKDIICGSKKGDFSIYQTQPPAFFSSMQLLTKSTVSFARRDEHFCMLHPAASFRTEVEKLTRNMSQEIDRDIKELISPLPDKEIEIAPSAQEKKIAEQNLRGSIDQFVSNLGEYEKKHPTAVSKTRDQIEESLKANPPNYKLARAHIRTALRYFEQEKIPTGTMSPDFEKLRENIALIETKKTPTSVPCSVSQEMQNLLNSSPTNSSFIRAELTKIKAKCPDLDIDQTTQKMKDLSRKRTALALANREKMILEADVQKATQKYRGDRKNLTQQIDKINQNSIENLNRIGLEQFSSQETGKSAGLIAKWGQSIGMMPSSLTSLVKTARNLSAVALMAGGKAALAASAGVPGIAVEEAVLRSISYTPEECISGGIGTNPWAVSSAEAKLGFHFLDYGSTDCKPTIQLGAKLTQFLQLNDESKQSLLSKNDQLCSAILKLHESQYQNLANFEAICQGSQGNFKLRDLKAEAGNYKVIQNRAKEARKAGLSGLAYEDYVKGDLVSFDHNVQVEKDGFKVQYTSVQKQKQSCAHFTVTSESHRTPLKNSCKPLTQLILDNTYNYAAISAHCAGEKTSLIDGIKIKHEPDQSPGPSQGRTFRGRR